MKPRGLVVASLPGAARVGDSTPARPPLRQASRRVSSTLLLFTKNPHPGRVKTRLIGSLTAEQAAELHAAFVGDVVERLAGGSYRLVVAWALAEDEEPLLEILPRPLPWLRQRGRDLGERLFAALREAADGGAEALAAIGSDHPEVERASVERAFGLLEGGADVALGPAADGGYYLIAVSARALCRELFEDIDWSTPRVYAQTLRRCREAGLVVAQLETADDVDTPRDLDRLIAVLRGDRRRCPRSAQLLARWGML